MPPSPPHPEQGAEEGFPARPERPLSPPPNAFVAAGLAGDFLALAHDLVGLGSYVVNLRTQIVYISREMALLLGAGDAPFQIPLEAYRRRFYTPESYAPTSAKADAAYAEGQPVWLDARIIRGDGRLIWVRSASILRTNEAGDPVRVGMLRDVTEQREAQDALEKSEELYRNIVENAREGIIAYDRDWRISFANACGEAIFGYGRGELLGRPIRDIILEEDRADHLARLRKWEAGHQGEYEGCYLRKDGSRVWLQVSGWTVFEEGAFAGVYTMISDITDRKQAEERLRASESRFRTLIEQAPLAMGVGRNGQTIYINQKYRELFQIPGAEDVTGHSFIDHWAPESRPMIQEYAHRRSHGEPAPSEYEGVGLRRDGKRIPIQASVTVVQLQEGPASVVFLIDLTERCRAEEALRQAEELYRGIFEGAAEGIFRTSPEGRPLAANPTMAHLLGFDSPAQLLEEVPDTGAALWPTPADRQRFAEALDAHGEVRNYEGQLKRRDGTLFWALTSARRVSGPDGRPRYFEGFVSDITEKKQLEEQFLRVQRLESLGMLAAGIAHDLNNVLQPIGMAVPLLRATRVDPKEERILDMLERSAERGAGLVRQILGFARGAGGEPQLVQVKHLLRDMVDMIRQTFPKSIVLEESLPRDLRPVLANPTQLHQVLMNLCVNARDAMPQGGTLRLSGSEESLSPEAAATLPGARPGKWLVLAVEDTGTGMPPEVLARIWDPFFTTKDLGKGTGLGLSTVRGLVEAHGGFLAVDSQPGRGTTFRVYLPSEFPGQAVSASPARATSRQGHGERILFVDDEPSIRDLVERTLTHAGYEVILAQDGASGLASFRAQPDSFALIVTDMDMPGVDGPTFARAVKALQPATRILAVSGLEQGQGDVDWHGFAEAFLLKPFPPSELVTAVQRLLSMAPGPLST
ncbi:MAG TPA: PAS domain S-box protein [Holophagaceae bacterium]|nr:PAS domain S-box protein [Holophagaceae bacterium]